MPAALRRLPDLPGQTVSRRVNGWRELLLVLMALALGASTFVLARAIGEIGQLSDQVSALRAQRDTVSETLHRQVAQLTRQVDALTADNRRLSALVEQLGGNPDEGRPSMLVLPSVEVVTPDSSSQPPRPSPSPRSSRNPTPSPTPSPTPRPSPSLCVLVVCVR